MKRELKRVCVIMDSDTIKKLDNITKNTDFTKSHITRAALNEYFNRHQNLLKED